MNPTTRPHRTIDPEENPAGPRPAKRPRRSANRGWYLRERGGRWLAHARDPQTKKYEAETFSDRRSGEAWAKARHAQFVLKKATAGATRQYLQTIGDDYLVALELAQASQRHVEHIRHVLKKAVAAGITDLGAPNVVEKTRLLLLGLTSRHGQPATPATRNKFLKVLRAIGNFAVKHDRAEKNPFNKIDMIRVTRSLREVFTLDELRALVSPSMSDHPFHAAFCSMAYTGFRLREMANLDWSWFLWDDQRIAMQVERKARAFIGHQPTGFVPKNKQARITRLMTEYAEIMQAIRPANCERGLIFPHLRTISNKSLQERFNRYLLACGVEVKERTPHSCRHSWTCLMLASGEDEFLVQQYAGHSQKEMTAHYARLQDRYTVQMRRAGWPRGELCLRRPIAAAPSAPSPAVTLPPLRLVQ